tara:strand:+ start:218 stop:667 length:450 start_codon:yes stop_codon:yes gene_type:complete
MGRALMTSLVLRKQTKNFSNRLLWVFFCFGILITGHNAFAQLQFYPAPQPQVNYEIIKGDAQLSEYPAELQYPTRASTRGIVGWVEVRFDIDTGGKVIAHTIEIVDAAPKGIFDSSTRRAVERFIFSPNTFNGAPIIVSDVRYRFQYSM